jgi:hypothetical protein
MFLYRLLILNNTLRIIAWQLLVGASDDFIVYLVDDTPKTHAEAYASPDAKH